VLKTSPARTALLLCLLIGGCKAPEAPAGPPPAPPDHTKLPAEVQQLLDMDTPFSPTAAAAVKRLSKQTQQDIEKCLTTKEGQACFHAFTPLDLHQSNADPGNEIKDRLYKRGCALGSAEGCVQWAREEYPKDPSLYDAALAVFQRNCETTFINSCEDVGILLQKRGKDAEAMDAFAKVCTSDETRGCKRLGMLAKTDAQRSKLKAECDGAQGGSCLAYSYATREAGKAVLMDRCLNLKQDQWSTRYICEEAAKMIELPSDVRAFVGKQQACFRIGQGEYYGPWSRYIIEGLKEPCVDRDAEYTALIEVYKNEPDITFALRRHKSKNVEGTWTWEIEQPETNH
jgi:hypothetical protein